MAAFMPSSAANDAALIKPFKSSGVYLRPQWGFLVSKENNSFGIMSSPTAHFDGYQSLSVCTLSEEHTHLDTSYPSLNWREITKQNVGLAKCSLWVT